MTETETWIWYEQTGDWHLIWTTRLINPLGPGPDEPGVEYDTWCGLTLDGRAERKPVSQLSGWSDLVHDECYRKSLG